VLRKRKQPTPAFRLPPPYNPITGEHAALETQGVFPYTAMFQVAAEDTHVNYVICRGFDIRHNVFVDYAAGNTDKPGIPVAKPFGRRRVGVYTVGQIFPAVLPLQTSNPSPTSVEWRVGQNPGVSETTAGHPADLSEKVDELKDDDDKYIDWLLIDEGTDPSSKFKTWYYSALNCHGNIGGSGGEMDFYLAHPTGYSYPATLTLPDFADDGVRYINITKTGNYFFCMNLYVPMVSGLDQVIYTSVYMALQQISNPANRHWPVGGIWAQQTFYSDTPPNNLSYVTASRTAVATVMAGYRLQPMWSVYGVSLDYADEFDIYAELTIGPWIS